MSTATATGWQVDYLDKKGYVRKKRLKLSTDDRDKVYQQFHKTTRNVSIIFQVRKVTL